MQKSKNITIIILIIMLAYFLFSQFYLKNMGNLYTYVINPLFFILIAILLKCTTSPLFKMNKYKKTFIQYVLITTLAYGILYLISGIFLTYGKNPYSTTIKGLILNLYSTGIIIVCREYIRFKLINNVFEKERKLIFILIVITFSIGEISIASLLNSVNIYFAFKVFFSVALPSIVKNCLLTYIEIYTDYIPSILYEIILHLIQWIPPVLPNAPWFFYAITDILFPLTLLIYCIYHIALKDKHHLYKLSNPLEPKGLITISIGIVLVIWFAVGIFPIKPVGIASASMEPNLKIGDLVIVKKCNANSINENDIIEYKRKNFTVIHRVINKRQIDGKIIFITKGDNNNDPDNDPVQENQLNGIVIARIPYIAWPTIWLERLSSRQSYVDVETGK